MKNILIFCLIWSVGASIDYESRKKFNEEVRKTLAKKGYQLLSNSYYDYHYNEKTNEFEDWKKLFSNFDIPSQN